MPAAAAERPRTFCSSRVAPTMYTHDPTLASVPATVSTTNSRLCSNDGRTSGCATRRSTSANTTSRARPPSSGSTVTGLDQPCWETSSIAMLTNARPPTTVSTPHQSRPRSVRGADSSRESASRVPRQIANAAMGTLSRNTQRHPAVEARTPPTTGPSAVPTPAMPSSAPMIRGRSCSLVALLTRAKAVGMMSAAPTPCATRAATSTGTDVASPQISEVIPKIAMPSSSIARRPSRSPARPAGMSREPSAIR